MARNDTWDTTHWRNSVRSTMPVPARDCVHNGRSVVVPLQDSSGRLAQQDAVARRREVVRHQVGRALRAGRFSAAASSTPERDNAKRA
jgi:hypothetical protein